MPRVLLPLLVPAGLVAAALVGWQVVQAASPAPEAPAARGAGGVPAVPQPRTARPEPAEGRAAPARERSAAGGVARLRLPDGTEVEPLNGVRAPAPLAWHDGPWSPIVGIERSRDVDWYVHADGTRTTTVEVFRGDLGRTDPLTLVARPGEPLPVDF